MKPQHDAGAVLVRTRVVSSITRKSAPKTSDEMLTRDISRDLLEMLGRFPSFYGVKVRVEVSHWDLPDGGGE